MAHNRCNMQCRYRHLGNMEDYRIPVVFHNLGGYDAHFLVRELSGVEEEVTVISKSLEKYLSFTLGNLVFIDSLNFLAGSLEHLAESCGAFPRLEREFPNSPDLKQKGVYPYEHITSLQVLEETSLPHIEDFYSNLKEQGISEEEYSRAQRVWRMHGCHTLRDYTRLYFARLWTKRCPSHSRSGLCVSVGSSMS